MLLSQKLHKSGLRTTKREPRTRGMIARIERLERELDSVRRENKHLRQDLEASARECRRWIRANQELAESFRPGKVG